MSAQLHIDAGVAIGTQGYEDSLDDPRILSGLELLLRGKSVGLHVASEYTDLETFGALISTHADVVYRGALGRNFSFLVGAGPTYVYNSEFDNDTTFNVEVEVARRFGRADVFARVRQFDYTIGSAPDERSPKGPAVYVGARFALR